MATSGDGDEGDQEAECAKQFDESEREEFRQAFGEYSSFLNGFRERFETAVASRWGGVKRVPSLSRSRADPWFELTGPTAVVRFGMVSDWYYSVLAVESEEAGSKIVEHDPKGARASWSQAKYMYSLSPDTVRMRDGRSRLDWAFVDDKSIILLTNQQQLDYAIRVRLDAWLTGIQEVVSKYGAAV